MTPNQPTVHPMPHRRRAVLTAAALLSVLSLAACGVSPKSSASAAPKPSPTKSSDTRPADDEGAEPVAPAADLTLDAGADLPAGLMASLSSTFAADSAWEAEVVAQAQQYRNTESDCSVRFGLYINDTDETDDRAATITAIRMVLDDDTVKDTDFIDFALPYDPTGVAVLTGEAEYQLELLGLSFISDGDYIFSSGRALTATDQLLVAQFVCPSEETLKSTLTDERSNITVGMLPAGLFGE